MFSRSCSTQHVLNSKIRMRSILNKRDRGKKKIFSRRASWSSAIHLPVPMSPASKTQNLFPGGESETGPGPGRSGGPPRLLVRKLCSRSLVSWRCPSVESPIANSRSTNLLYTVVVEQFNTNFSARPRRIDRNEFRASGVGFRPLLVSTPFFKKKLNLDEDVTLIFPSRFVILKGLYFFLD